jgi:hypothetical protein
MESSREAARVAIESAMAQVKEVVPGVPLDAPITLNAITPYSQTLQTTFGREVVHHDAIHSANVDSLINIVPFLVVVCRVARRSSLVYGMRLRLTAISKSVLISSLRF